MYDFIEGELEVKTPTHVTINCSGIGYFINISLNTYEQIRALNRCRMFIHLAVKEDSHTLYGFAEPNERVLYRQLISVSGVGTSTARMILSSLPPNDLMTTIINGNVALLKSIKGIGPKSAQRIILELQDKLGKKKMEMNIVGDSINSSYEEAAQALVALGFGRASIDRVLLKVSKEMDDDQDLQTMIKKSLKLL
jgi:Holliday junction DNA helicase RuvA